MTSSITSTRPFFSAQVCYYFTFKLSYIKWLCWKFFTSLTHTQTRSLIYILTRFVINHLLF
jgi:hypothetical protein